MQTEQAQYDRIILEELNITQTSIAEEHTENQYPHRTSIARSTTIGSTFSLLLPANLARVKLKFSGPQIPALYLAYPVWGYPR